jgi:hypothetical protein
MDLTIKLKIKNKPLVDNSSNSSTYPIGEVLKLEATFINTGNLPLKVTNPLIYGETIMLYRDSESIEDSLIYLNPGDVDVTGEMTAPIENEIELLPNTEVSKPIDLSQFIPEHIFTDKFEIQIKYDEYCSNTLKINMIFSTESVRPLVGVLVNENNDLFMRKRAYSYLQTLPVPLEFKFPENDETDSEKKQRTDQNDKMVNKFLQTLENI